MLIWWRSQQRILLRPGDLDRSRFYRDTLGVAITPAEAQGSARPRSMAAYAVAAGWDGLGAGPVPREVAAGRLERGAPLAGDEGPADPGHPQRPAVGGQQVQVARNARSGIAFASRTPQCAPKNASRSAEMMALVPRWPPAASSTSWTVDRMRGAARLQAGPEVRPAGVALLLSNCRAGELEMPTGAGLRAVGPDRSPM